MSDISEFEGGIVGARFQYLINGLLGFSRTRQCLGVYREQWDKQTNIQSTAVLWVEINSLMREVEGEWKEPWKITGVKWRCTVVSM